MHLLLQLLSSIAATILLYGLYTLFSTIIARINSPLKDFPGPPSSHWFWGNMKDIIASDAGVLHEKWVEQYGRTMKYPWILGRERLFTVDTKAINHILMNHYIYQKPEIARYNLTQLLGAGVLVTEEDKHKLQRKVMNPAFGPAQIRELTGIFIEKSIELRDTWMSEVAAAEGGVTKINVLNSLSEMTMDAIGLAGFNYKFNALDKTKGPSELKEAFSKIFGDPEAQRIRAWPLLQALIPTLRALPSQDAPGFKQARATMARIARELLRDSKASLQGTGEKDNWTSKDLLSILVRSNMSSDLSQRMSDEDVLAQIPTFIVAGHETSSTATTWALFALVENPDIQRKLRDELYTLSTENPSMDELNSLPYLDKVVRETLRVHSPVPGTIRVATKDDVIPLGKSFVDAKGVERDHVSIRKGQTVFVPIININRDKTLWGEDALEFKPDRWDNLPDAVSTIPGVWGNMLTFLGGARACIGYRFSLMEIKALLFILVRSFEFELGVPREDVISKTTVVQRPRLKSDKDGGSQLPLLVSMYQRS